MLDKLPMERRGLTQFTYSRFLVPYLCNFEGVAIFMDADVVVKADIAELAAQADGVSAVQVMKEQHKFEWASVMLFNCAQCKILTPEYIDDPANKLLELNFGPVGEFSKEWNHCVNRTEPEQAKLYHFTEGIPLWDEVRGSPLDSAWDDEYEDSKSTVSWVQLMGNSVHARPVLHRFLKRKFGVEPPKAA
jgi:lipopolysaccharide biosynthesis glycosyltransferase